MHAQVATGALSLSASRESAALRAGQLVRAPTQELFGKRYPTLDRSDATRPFEPWFWKLAANTAINYRRKRVPLPVDRPADHDHAAAAPERFEHDPVLVGAVS